MKALKALVMTLALSLAMPVWAQIPVPKELQGKTVTVVVPYPPGGQSDNWNRLTAAKVRELTGLNIVIVNKSGGNGLIGAAEVAKAKPDGLTLLGSESSPLVLGPLTQEPGFVPRDQFVTILASYKTSQGFYVRADSKYKNFKELLDDAKKEPGKLNIAYVTLVTELVLKQTAGELGLKVSQIPYKGTGPAITDLLGGHVDALVAPPVVLEQVRGGKARVLAFSGPNRLPGLANVDLLKEFVPGLIVENFGGMWAPAGTPKHIVDFYNRVYREAFRDPASQEFLRAGAAGLFDGSPEEAERFVQSNVNFWRPIVAKYPTR
jgi:tripartite-type tricarboxylate transporter receptor subunit TctC